MKTSPIRKEDDEEIIKDNTVLKIFKTVPDLSSSFNTRSREIILCMRTARMCCAHIKNDYCDVIIFPFFPFCLTFYIFHHSSSELERRIGRSIVRSSHFNVLCTNNSLCVYQMFDRNVAGMYYLFFPK